ncbi:sorting nexin-2 [Branchiostoma belcheri]|nr:sorting nexin-2 [Branchiostoma belcheri]
MADDREPPPLFDDEKPDKKEDEDDLFATPNEAPKEEVKDEPASLPTEPAQDKSEDLFAADDDLFGEPWNLQQYLAQNQQGDTPADAGKQEPEVKDLDYKPQPYSNPPVKPSEELASMARDQPSIKPVKVSVDLPTSKGPPITQNMQEDSADSPKLEVTDEPPPEMDISGNL